MSHCPTEKGLSNGTGILGKGRDAGQPGAYRSFAAAKRVLNFQWDSRTVGPQAKNDMIINALPVSH